MALAPYGICLIDDLCRSVRSEDFDTAAIGFTCGRSTPKCPLSSTPDGSRFLVFLDLGDALLLELVELLQTKQIQGTHSTHFVKRERCIGRWDIRGAAGGPDLDRFILDSLKEVLPSVNAFKAFRYVGGYGNAEAHRAFHVPWVDQPDFVKAFEGHVNDSSRAC